MAGAESMPQIFRPDGTTKILWELVGKLPPVVVLCNLAPEPAQAIFRTPKGCVARPGDQVQALCATHIGTWGVIGEGIGIIVDLDPATAPDPNAAALRLGYSALELMEYLEQARLDPRPPEGMVII